MKKKIFISVFILSAFYSTSSYAHFNPYTEGKGIGSAGFGISNWGIPIYVRYEHPVADNITVGGLFSFQTKSYTFGRNTYYGVVGRGSYHFNELFDIPDQFDIYGGASLGYYILKWKSNNTPYEFNYNPSDGEFSIGIHVGGTYFLNDNFGLNAELVGGFGFSGGTVGVVIML